MLSEADWHSCALGCILHLPPWGLPALRLWGWGPSIPHIWFVVFITVKISLLYETPTFQTFLMWWLIRILRKRWVIVTAWVQNLSFALLPRELSWVSSWLYHPSQSHAWGWGLSSFSKAHLSTPCAVSQMPPNVWTTGSWCSTGIYTDTMCIHL